MAKTIEVSFQRRPRRFPNGSVLYSIRVCELGRIDSVMRAARAVEWLLQHFDEDERIQGILVNADYPLSQKDRLDWQGVYVTVQEAQETEELRAEMLAVGKELQEFLRAWV